MRRMMRLHPNQVKNQLTKQLIKMCYDEQCRWNEQCRKERAATAAAAAKREGAAVYEAVPMIEYTP